MWASGDFSSCLVFSAGVLLFCWCYFIKAIYVGKTVQKIGSAGKPKMLLGLVHRRWKHYENGDFQTEQKGMRDTGKSIWLKVTWDALMFPNSQLSAVVVTFYQELKYGTFSETSQSVNDSTELPQLSFQQSTWKSPCFGSQCHGQNSYFVQRILNVF